MKCFRCGNPISGFECEKCGYTYLMGPLSTFAPLESGQITAINSVIQSALPQGARYVCKGEWIGNRHFRYDFSFEYITHHEIPFPRLDDDCDTEYALNWYKTRAANNDPIAQNNLGVYYLSRLKSSAKKSKYPPSAGEIKEAEALLRKSADAGNPVAMYNVSSYLDMQLEYHEHLSTIQKIKNAFSSPLFPVPTDKKETIMERKTMLEKSAEAGFSDAVNKLAHRYRFGIDGYPTDLPKSIELYTQSAGLGSSTAAQELARIYDALATKSEQPSKYIQKALSYYDRYFRSARYPIDTDGIDFARLLMNPQIKRYQEAADILQAIDIEEYYDNDKDYAKERVRRVSVMLAELYFNGLGVEQDPMEAYRYYRIAERHGDKEAGSAADGIVAHADNDDIVMLNTPQEASVYPAPSGSVKSLTCHVREDSACSACYAALVRGLYIAKKRGFAIDRSIAIGQGWRGQHPTCLGIGNCCAGAPDHAKGCPPTAAEVVSLLKRSR